MEQSDCFDGYADLRISFFLYAGLEVGDHYIGNNPIVDANHPVPLPGQGEIQMRRENLEKGIPAAAEKWDEVLAMCLKKLAF